MKKIFAILWALILLICVNLLDVQFRKNAMNFETPAKPHWDELAAYIFISILLLLLARYVLFVNSRNLLIPVTFVIVGAVVLYSWSVSGYFLWSSLIEFPEPVKLWYVDSVASDTGLVRYSSAMILSIGLLRLFSYDLLWGKSKQLSETNR